MIGHLRETLIHPDSRDGWTILQKGGGSYLNATIGHVDDVGISCIVRDAVRFIPWTSINEVYRVQRSR